MYGFSFFALRDFARVYRLFLVHRDLFSSAKKTQVVELNEEKEYNILVSNHRENFRRAGLFVVVSHNLRTCNRLTVYKLELFAIFTILSNLLSYWQLQFWFNRDNLTRGNRGFSFLRLLGQAVKTFCASQYKFIDFNWPRTECNQFSEQSASFSANIAYSDPISSESWGSQ